jgi:hypothetical protein
MTPRQFMPYLVSAIQNIEVFKQESGADLTLDRLDNALVDLLYIVDEIDVNDN